jgi:hypothetical protein
MEQEILNDTQIREALRIVNSKLTNNTLDLRAIWGRNADIGHQLYQVKNSFNGSTKEFGQYLDTNCPKLDVKLVSYFIKLAGYNDDQYDSGTIIKWLADNNCQATNPRTCWDKFNKAHKTEPDADTKNGKVTETSADPLDKQSIVARLESLLDEIKTAELDDIEIARLQALNETFSEVIDNL